MHILVGIDFNTKNIFSCYVLLDKIHTFPCWVERELEIPGLRVYLCYFSGVFSKYNNPVFEISEWWLGLIVGYRISNIIPREFLD